MKTFKAFIWLIAALWSPQSAQEQMYRAEIVRVTAYCPCEKCCGKWADGITASGHKIKPGDKFCAAPRNIPFGTMLDIPEYGVVPVLDRGGAIVEGRLDVFFPTHQEALNWGVKHCAVRSMHRMKGE